MKQFEYKCVDLPSISAKNFVFCKQKDINDIRVPNLEESFNSLGKDGWELVNIYWLEGLAIFKKEI